MLVLEPQHYYLLQQPWWGMLIALYLFLGGLGAMAFCTSFYFWRRKGNESLVVGGSILGLIAVLIGTIFLILDLGHPERFYLVLLSPKLNLSSWIAIGSVLLLAFMIFTALFVAPMLRWFRWLPWAKNETVIRTFGWLGFITGIGVAAYTGILIGIVFNIPFWNAPALPVIFMISAFSTGLASLILMMLFLDREAHEIHVMAKTDGFTMTFELIVITIFLLIRSYGPVAAAESVNTILFGWLAPYFVGGVLLIGLAIPIMLIFGYEVKRPGVTAVTAISAIFVLIGGALLRYVVLEAGILQIPCCV